jgi:ribonuclease HI
MSIIDIWCDGGCEGNGLPTAYCYGSYYIFREGATVTYAKRKPLPSAHTNNEAEYDILVDAIVDLEDADIPDDDVIVIVHTDSALVIGQVFENWKINKPELRDRVNLIHTLMKSAPAWKWQSKLEKRADIVTMLGH